MDLWREIVSLYSDKAISLCTDRLAAIQGAVEALFEAVPDPFKREDYLFGLWKPFLVRCMAWSRHPRALGNAEAVSMLKNIAPSWSWITAISAMHYYSTLSDPAAVELTLVEEIEYHHTEASDTVFGAGGCALVLWGMCIPVTLYEGAVLSDAESIPFLLPERFGKPGDIPIVDMIADDPTDERVFDRVTHFAPLVCFGDYDSPRMQGLFLEKVGKDEEGGKEVFKRVGFGYDYTDRVELSYGDYKDWDRELSFYKLI
jgi:hypothetical protein